MPILHTAFKCSKCKWLFSMSRKWSETPLLCDECAWKKRKLKKCSWCNKEMFDNEKYTPKDNKIICSKCTPIDFKNLNYKIIEYS